MSIISRNSSVISANSGPESKYYKMKKLIIAIKDYLNNPTDEISNSVSRYLQALSVTIDLSIFDPHTNIACEFFVNLYQLMNKGQTRSPLAWYCVEVLSNVCKNTSARSALIHTYQFLPSLSRLLQEQLVNDKKLKLLKLIQDLTCGIKISWQIPYLSHLMTTLAKWIESKDDEIVTLSLGILVNLCYNNLPAVFTLNSNVDVKKLYRTCLAVKKDPILEAHLCILWFILDYTEPFVSKERMMTVIFHSIEKAFKSRDYIMLRQLIEFHTDVVDKQFDKNDRGDAGKLFEKEISTLLKMLQNKSEENNDNSYSECVSLIFQLFHYLIENNFNCSDQTYESLIKSSLEWINNDTVSSYAISILKIIAQKMFECDKLKILIPLESKIELFLFALDMGVHDDIEHNKKIGSILHLLRVMLKVETLRLRILSDLREDTMYKVFYPLLGDDSPRSRTSDDDFFSEESINLYTSAMTFLMELGKYDHKWVLIFENFLQQKQIHFILSQALYTGSTETKNQILMMSKSNFFPTNGVAKSMRSLQKLTILNSIPPSKCTHFEQKIYSPILSVTQEAKLDFLIDKLRDSSSKNLLDISTSEVLELYEYKLTTMSHAERSALANVEAATEKCTQLEHRNAQLITEMNKLHQLFLHTQQKFEEVTKTKREFEKKIEEMSELFEKERGRCKAFQGKLAQEEKKSNGLRMEIDDLLKRLEETNESRNQLEEQQTKLKHLIEKLEDNCARVEKNLLKKEQALLKANNEIENWRKQVCELESEKRLNQEMLNRKNEEIENLKEELVVKSNILDTIKKFANSSHSNQSYEKC